MNTSRRSPPPSAAAQPRKTTPNTSSCLATPADPPEAAKAASPTRSAISRAVAVSTAARLAPDDHGSAERQFVVLVDRLALRAHRELLRIAGRNPNLVAKGSDGRPVDHGLHDLVLVGVVREALVVALIEAVVGALLGPLVDQGARVGSHRSGHPPILSGSSQRGT